MYLGEYRDWEEYDGDIFFCSFLGVDMVIKGVVLFLLYGDWEEFGWFFVLYFVDFLFVMVRYVELKDLFMILCFYLMLFNLLLII